MSSSGEVDEDTKLESEDTKQKSIFENMLTKFSPVVREKIENERKRELQVAASKFNKKGRCKLCTLKFPCKHFTKEQPEEIPVKREGSPVQKPRSKLSSQSVKREENVQPPETLNEEFKEEENHSEEEKEQKDITKSPVLKKELMRTVRVRGKNSLYKWRKQDIRRSSKGTNHLKRKNSEQEARHKVKLLEKLLKYKQEKIRKEKEKIEEEYKLRKIMILKEK